jgi:hypothetical protein
MTAVAPQLRARDSRKRHQAKVAALLDAIDERRRELYRLQAAGATRAGVAGLKDELKGIRTSLAATLARAS